MTSVDSVESRILEACASGALAPERAFNELYAIYERSVRAMLIAKVGPAFADDLAQEAWSVFHRRWLVWKFPPEMSHPDARPVLAFLFRSCHLIVAAHRRLQGHNADLQPLEAAVSSASRDSVDVLNRHIELGRCLAAARRHCTDDELNVVLGKLAGFSARELSSSLGLSEAVVDHRFRNAITRLKGVLGVDQEGI